MTQQICSTATLDSDEDDGKEERRKKTNIFLLFSPPHQVLRLLVMCRDKSKDSPH